MSDFAKAARTKIRTVVSMTPRIDAIGIVVADMAAALDFYRRLGIEVPVGADAEPHVEVNLPGGFRVMFDTEATTAGPRAWRATTRSAIVWLL